MSGSRTVPGQTSVRRTRVCPHRVCIFFRTGGCPHPVGHPYPFFFLILFPDSGVSAPCPHPRLHFFLDTVAGQSRERPLSGKMMQKKRGQGCLTGCRQPPVREKLRTGMRIGCGEIRVHIHTSVVPLCGHKKIEQGCRTRPQRPFGAPSLHLPKVAVQHQKHMPPPFRTHLGGPLSIIRILTRSCTQERQPLERRKIHLAGTKCIPETGYFAKVWHHEQHQCWRQM